MKRFSLAGMTLAALAIAALAVGGCTSASPSSMDTSKVWGYVASADKAQLEVAENQDGVNELVVKRVLAPSDAWVVVHADMDGAPGKRVGIAQVKSGESLDVKVPLEGLTTPKVIVAIHADRGTAGEFDFDMMNKEMSPDRPYFVDEAELAKMVTVRDFGVPTTADQASIVASEQIDSTSTITMASVSAPNDAWIVVHLEKDGGPGQRVGLLHVPAGETSNAVVTLDPVPLTPNLLVAVHTDAGDPGLFNFDMEDKLNSTDQPFFVDGKELAIKVRVK
jgi:hypothetical protein